MTLPADRRDELMGTEAAPDVEPGPPVETDFFAGRQATTVAEDLLGTLLVVETEEAIPVGGVIVETEAYVNDLDPACHLTAGRTERTEPFFSGPGTVYVYKIWWNHNLNFITEYAGHPEGVLIRAVAPTYGLDIMRERRETTATSELTTGPGKLTEALGIKKEEYDNRPLTETPLTIYETDYEPSVTVGPRIGVSEADDWPLRFCDEDSPFLSKPIGTTDTLDYDAVAQCYRHLEQRE